MNAAVGIRRMQHVPGFAAFKEHDPSKRCYQVETAGDDILDGTVVRERKAYPVYDDAYARNVALVRQEIESHYPNLHPVGRNGMH